jgi:nucleoside phosphorylase
MGEREAYIRELVTAYADALRKRVRLDRIILFGSCAGRDDRQDSDIDLLVVSPDFGRDVLFDMDVLRGCLPPHTEAIDTLGCTPAELDAAEPGDILDTASRGRVVYGLPLSVRGSGQ